MTTLVAQGTGDTNVEISGKDRSMGSPTEKIEALTLAEMTQRHGIRA